MPWLPAAVDPFLEWLDVIIWPRSIARHVTRLESGFDPHPIELVPLQPRGLHPRVRLGCALPSSVPLRAREATPAYSSSRRRSVATRSRAGIAKPMNRQREAWSRRPDSNRRPADYESVSIWDRWFLVIPRAPAASTQPTDTAKLCALPSR